MLLRKQQNILLTILQNVGLSIQDFQNENYELRHVVYYTGKNQRFSFEILQGKSSQYSVMMSPGLNSLRGAYSADTWDSVQQLFVRWATNLKDELDTPDLWAEAAATAQLFAPTATPSDDKFTRTELAAVQGQLRQLEQSFAKAALPEAARQKLIELTQTAAVKAEGLTKKDWQTWIIGGLVQAITALLLNPTQAAEVLKLVKAAFGGLFLH